MKLIRGWGACVAAGLMISASACVTRPGFLQPSPKREFDTVLLHAQEAANNGRFAEADRMLAGLAARDPEGREAAETSFWRGLFKLDPMNPDTARAEGLADLDRYLATAPQGAHVMEAQTVRRLAMQVQLATRLASANATTLTSGTRAAGTAPDPRDDEIQRLKDALAKANDELERIKRRLSAPTRP